MCPAKGAASTGRPSLTCAVIPVHQVPALKEVKEGEVVDDVEASLGGARHPRRSSFTGPEEVSPTVSRDQGLVYRTLTSKAS